MVFSASAVIAKERYHSGYFFLLRQMGWAVAGFAAMIVGMGLDYKKLKHPAFVFGVLGLTTLMLISAFERIPSPAQLEFIRGCFTKVRARIAISASVIVGVGRCTFSASALHFFCAPTNSLQSTSRTTKKCGTLVQLCVVRSAISRATWDSASTPAGAAATTAPEPFESAACCTSSLVIVPSGPVPRICAMSTQSSFASRRAFGEICGAASPRCAKPQLRSGWRTWLCGNNWPCCGVRLRNGCS